MLCGSSKDVELVTAQYVRLVGTRQCWVEHPRIVVVETKHGLLKTVAEGTRIGRDWTGWMTSETEVHEVVSQTVAPSHR